MSLTGKSFGFSLYQQTKASAPIGNPLKRVQNGAYIGEQPVLDRTTVGCLASESLTDIDFTDDRNLVFYEHQGVHFWIRIDTNKADAQSKKSVEAEVLARMNIKAGTKLKKETRQAIKEQVLERLQDMATTGKFLKTKMIEAFWYPEAGYLWVDQDDDNIPQIFRKIAAGADDNLDFGFYPVTFGTLAEDLIGERASDLRPSSFSEPGTPAVDELPWADDFLFPLDWLGSEFLSYACWNPVKALREADNREIQLSIIQDLLLACQTGETGTAKFKVKDGNPLANPDVRTAFRIGKLARQAGLVIGDSELGYRLTIDADKFKITGARESATRQIDEASKFRPLIDLTALLSRTIRAFYTFRTSGHDWDSTITWIRQQHVQPKP